MYKAVPLLLLMSLLAVGPESAAEPRQAGDMITVTAGGDMIGPVHPMNHDDPALRDVSALFQGADVGFVNQENSIFDVDSFTGYPAAENGGGRPVRLPSHATDLKKMGVSMVSSANNHAVDWGSDGLLQTLDNLAKAGVVAGGAGLSDVAARAPVYLDTKDGVVGLVATTSTFPPSAMAGAAVDTAFSKSRPRPGVSTLHVREVRLLPTAMLASLIKAAGPFALHEGSDIRISDQVFRRSDAVGTLWEMKPSDEKEILAAVSTAKSHARLVIFSIHAHETAGDADEPAVVPYEPSVLRKANEAPSPDDPTPASFEVDLFHAAIDHGADTIFRTGPHVIGGIEIYKGKPIFYGLGSLFLDFLGERVLHTPGGDEITVPNAWFESFVPISQFSSDRVRTIKLYPISIEPAAGARSGVPSIAHGARALAILNRLKALSAPFGTTVKIVGEIGVIAIDDAGRTS